MDRADHQGAIKVMGTSMSSKGPKGKNPLVPPWAEQGDSLQIDGGQVESGGLEIDNQDVQDLIPDVQQIQPSSTRLQGARRAFGDYAKSGARNDLSRSLKKYSRAVGGSSGAARRLASGVISGAGLFGLLNGGSVSTSEGVLSLSDLSGLSTDQAIDRISGHLSPNSADADNVRTAMNYALSEALETYSYFDDVEFTPELLGQVFTCYLTDLVFEQVVLDMGEMWFHAESANRQIQMENELRQLIKVVVDIKLDDVSGSDLSKISNSEINSVQVQTIRAVIEEWEQF